MNLLSCVSLSMNGHLHTTVHARERGTFCSARGGQVRSRTLWQKAKWITRQGMLSVGPSDSTFLKSSICFERLSPCLASFLTRRMPCSRATRPSVTRKKSRKELPERTTRRPPVTLDPSPSPAWNRRRYARSETSQLVATHQAAGALPDLFELHVANVLQTASERGGGVIHLLASTFVMRNAHVCV